MLGRLKVSVAHEVPYFCIRFDDGVDQGDRVIVLGDVLLEFLDQNVLLLLLRIDATDVTEQITKGVTAQ